MGRKSPFSFSTFAMDISTVFLVVSCCVFVAGLPSATLTGTMQKQDLEALLKKEKESEAVPPVELSKETTFIQNYNDTDTKGSQSVSSKMNSLRGLENKIQNLGGVQNTVLNNKVQYNFYFWLVPKNFTRPAERNEKR